MTEGKETALVHNLDSGNYGILVLAAVLSIWILPVFGLPVFGAICALTLISKCAWLDYKSRSENDIVLRFLSYGCVALSAIATAYLWLGIKGDLNWGAATPNSKAFADLLVPFMVLAPLFAPAFTFMFDLLSPHPAGLIAKFAPTIFCICSFMFFIVGFLGGE